MSGPRDLPQDRDVSGLFGLRPDFVDEKAPNPVDWWAIAGVGASNDVRVFDFATGYSAAVVVNATAPVRLFPQGMIVREPMILNLSANIIEIGFSPSIIYGSGGSGLFRLFYGSCWTKYGVQYIPGLVTALLGNVRIQDGTAGTLATVRDASGDGLGAAALLGLATQSVIYGYNGATFDRVRTVSPGDSVAATGLLAASPMYLRGDASNFDRVRTVEALADGGARGIPAAGIVGLRRAGGGVWDRLVEGEDNGDGIVTQGLGLLMSIARGTAFNGTTWDRLRTATAFDNTPSVLGSLSATPLVIDLGTTATGVNAAWNLLGASRLRNVSAVNTQQQLVFDLRNLHDTLAILMVCSGGTATLTVEASSDNTNWLTIDSIAAAASTAKQYTATTVGGTTALSPISFRWVRITAGAAGAGNTTTLTVAAK